MGLKENYDKLFASMASSTDISKMKTFGKVSNDVMYWLINNYPDLAKGFIDRLQSVGWHNYLSEDEAMTMAMRAEDDLGMYGMVSIYDRVEKIFFN
jgi:hypothetical protein